MTRLAALPLRLLSPGDHHASRHEIRRRVHRLDRLHRWRLAVEHRERSGRGRRARPSAPRRRQDRRSAAGRRTDRTRTTAPRARRRAAADIGGGLLRLFDRVRHALQPPLRRYSGSGRRVQSPMAWIAGRGAGGEINDDAAAQASPAASASALFGTAPTPTSTASHGTAFRPYRRTADWPRAPSIAATAAFSKISPPCARRRWRKAESVSTAREPGPAARARSLRRRRRACGRTPRPRGRLAGADDRRADRVARRGRRRSASASVRSATTPARSGPGTGSDARRGRAQESDGRRG